MASQDLWAPVPVILLTSWPQDFKTRTGHQKQEQICSNWKRNLLILAEERVVSANAYWEGEAQNLLKRSFSMAKESHGTTRATSTQMKELILSSNPHPPRGNKNTVIINHFTTWYFYCLSLHCSEKFVVENNGFYRVVDMRMLLNLTSGSHRRWEQATKALLSQKSGVHTSSRSSADSNWAWLLLSVSWKMSFKKASPLKLEKTMEFIWRVIWSYMEFIWRVVPVEHA